jgi:hypothetical protein
MSFSFAFYQSAGLLLYILSSIVCVFSSSSLMRISRLFLCCCCCCTVCVCRHTHTHTGVWFGVVGGRQVDVINGYIFFFFGFLFFLKKNKRKKVSFVLNFFLFVFRFFVLRGGHFFLVGPLYISFLSFSFVY